MYPSVQYNLSLILHFDEKMPPPRIDVRLELACTPTENIIYENI